MLLGSSSTTSSRPFGVPSETPNVSQYSTFPFTPIAEDSLIYLGELAALREIGVDILAVSDADGFRPRPICRSHRTRSCSSMEVEISVDCGIPLTSDETRNWSNFGHSGQSSYLRQ